jgi:hypothetical protein
VRRDHQHIPAATTRPPTESVAPARFATPSQCQGGRGLTGSNPHGKEVHSAYRRPRPDAFDGYVNTHVEEPHREAHDREAVYVDVSTPVCQRESTAERAPQTTCERRCMIFLHCPGARRGWPNGLRNRRAAEAGGGDLNTNEVAKPVAAPASEIRQSTETADADDVGRGDGRSRGSRAGKASARFRQPGSGTGSRGWSALFRPISLQVLVRAVWRAPRLCLLGNHTLLSNRTTGGASTYRLACSF